jgi:hypothetical protein
MHKKSGNILILAIILLALGIASGIVIFLKYRTKPKSVTTTQIQQNQKAAVPNYTFSTTWTTFQNPKYGYEITNPGGWLLTKDDADLASVNLRLSTDTTPAESGFSIGVYQNSKYKTMKELCDNTTPDTSGVLCTDHIKGAQITIGSVAWNQYTTDSIGLPPTGYVAFDTYHNGNMYVIYSSISNFDDITKVLKSFTFISN